MKWMGWFASFVCGLWASGPSTAPPSTFIHSPWIPVELPCFLCLLAQQLAEREESNPSINETFLFLSINQLNSYSSTLPLLLWVVWLAMAHCAHNPLHKRSQPNPKKKPKEKKATINPINCCLHVGRNWWIWLISLATQRKKKKVSGRGWGGLVFSLG